MKWFKHMSNARKDKVLRGIFREFGLEGEARFWRLVELLSENFEKNGEPKFQLDMETLRDELRYRSATYCRPFLDLLATLTEITVNYSGNYVEIHYPKMAEIKDNHTKNLQVTKKRISKNLPLDIDIDKEKIYILSETSSDYVHPLDIPNDPKPTVKTKQEKFKPDLEKLYADYPRKEGKKKAFEKLNKLITSEEIFTQVHTAIKNYAKQSADKETRYVKQFSSFVSVWEDYLVVAEKKLSDFTEDEALAYFEEKLSTPGAFGFGRDHV